MAIDEKVLQVLQQKARKDGLKKMITGESSLSPLSRGINDPGNIAPDDMGRPLRGLNEFNRKMHGKGSNYMPGRQVPAIMEPTDPGYIPDEEEEGMA